MSEVRDDYVRVHPQDAYIAMAALEVLIEKGRLNGMAMENEKLTLSRIKEALDKKRKEY